AMPWKEHSRSGVLLRPIRQDCRAWPIAMRPRSAMADSTSEDDPFYGMRIRRWEAGTEASSADRPVAGAGGPGPFDPAPAGAAPSAPAPAWRGLCAPEQAAGDLFRVGARRNCNGARVRVPGPSAGGR